MIRHIVFWKLADTAEGNDKLENARIIKQQLEALVGVIPGLVEAMVGVNFNGGEYDAALYSRFVSKEALDNYATHPAHVAVKTFVHAVAIGRQSVDFVEE